MRALRSTAAAAPLVLLVGLLAPVPISAQAAPDIPDAIARFTSRFQDAVRSYDVETWATLVSEDIVMMAPSGRTVEGREAFRALWSRTFEGQSGPNPLRIDVQEVRVSGDQAIVRANYGPEAADPVGQYVWVLEHDDGEEWLLSWWIFNRRS